ncbi:MAG: DNA primase [Prevotella sp.]|nr:DNA primase [Prevotella sp.]
MIDRATVDRIMDAANIVDVVSEFVALKKSGANYKGLCPFHNERTPSFYVSPARGICKCFSCGKGGNAVNFIMEMEQINYPEALRWLANKYHIEIKERELTDEEREEENRRESMFIVNDWAASYFEDLLHNNQDGQTYGMQYFRSRGFRDDIVRKFRLGYDLRDGYALPNTALKKGYKEEFLLSTGICYKREKDGKVVDRFAGRVIFPWLGLSGKVVGFGGRKLDQATKGVQQKYVNSPDSEIYHKEQQLYGIYQAKKAIARENCVYMVEGYTDVISMHQCGIENVVANSGTALSFHQIRMLHRFTSNIVLLYDGDEAGIHAAMRGTDMLLQEGMNVKVLVLPDGDDPDSFARKHTADDFRKYIEDNQADIIQFKTNLMLKGVTDPIKRAEAVNSIIRSISVIPDQIVRATYLTECTHRLGINEATLISSMNKMIRNDKEQKNREAERERERQQNIREQAPPETAQAPTVTGTEVRTQRPLGLATPLQQASTVERMLVQVIIRHGEKIIYRNVATDDGNTIDLTVAQYISYDLGADGLSFSQPQFNQILDEATQHSTEPGFKAADYFVRHNDVTISQVAAEMVLDRVQLAKSLQMKVEEDSLRHQVEHLVLDFRMDYVEHKLKEIQQQIRESSGDTNRMMELMAQFKDLQLIRNNMAKMLGTNFIV